MGKFVLVVIESNVFFFVGKFVIDCSQRKV